VTPPYVTPVTVSVEEVRLKTNTVTPRGVPAGVCVHENEAWLVELADTDVAS
jgi:hypothetical protein